MCLNALVIDDSRAIRLIMSRMLIRLGFEVTEAAHGGEALKALEQDATKFAVAFVDWNMPEVNGLEFIQAVRAKPEYSGLRIVMVTTETQVEQMMLALEAGANEYVMKPFTDAAIEDKLRLLDLLDQPALPQQ